MTDTPIAMSTGNNPGNGTGNNLGNGFAAEYTGKTQQTVDGEPAAMSEPSRGVSLGGGSLGGGSLESRSVAPSPLKAVPVERGFRHDLGAQVCFNPGKELEPRIARLEDEMEVARRGGVFGLMRLRYEAWLEERMVGPAVRKLQARQTVLEQQVKTAEAEIRLKVTVQSGEVGAQRHKIEWNEVNRQRLAGELQSLGMITLSPGPAPTIPSISSPPPVTTHVTDEQVEAVALRGFLQGVETEEDWLVFKSELGQHLSPYAVEEVGGRLRELWRLNRQAGV